MMITGAIIQALQHSKVKLAWDEDDAQRKQLAKKAFSSQHDIQETELKAYLASDSDSDVEDKAKAADKYRALLGGLTFGGQTKSELAGEMEVTFTSGLAEPGGKGGQVLDDDEETTIEKYRRKEKERRTARRAKMLAARATDAGGKQDVGAEPEPKPGPKPESQEPGGTLGFDDPFFDEPAQSNAALRKAEKQKRRQEKAKEAAEKASKRAELELLMADDNDDGKKLSHFDMKQIVKAEKQKQKATAKKSRSSKRRLAEPDGLQEDFEMDVKDPRFAPVFERHDFAIDPTNPRFVKTEATKKLMDERRRRSAAARGGGGAAPDEDGRERKRKRTGGGRKDELLGLVQSLKRKVRP